MALPLSKTLQALSDPTRRQILQMLNNKDMTAGEIADVFNISKPSISHHLNKLKDAELVVTERNGQSIIYALNSSVLQESLQELMGLFQPKEK